MTIIFPFIFAIVGLVGVIWCLVIISRSVDSEEWRRTDCKILESTVEEITGESTEYRAIVKYEYFVDGLLYQGDTVRFGRSSILKTTANNICKKYPKGAIARVSFDPENPQRSVLIPGISPSIYGLAFIFIVFLAIGVGTLIDEIAK